MSESNSALVTNPGFWQRRSRAGKTVIVVAGIALVGAVGNAGPGPNTPDASQVANGVGPTIAPASLAIETAPPIDATDPPKSESPDPSPLVSVTPKPVKPTATPQIVTIDDQVSFVKAKVSVSGHVGTYTWSSVEFKHRLTTIRWTARATSSKACKVTWRVTPDEWAFVDPFGATVKVKPGASVSGAKQVDVEEASGQLRVTSTCPKWRLAGTSYSAPAYWNPWGFNFVPGRVIYNYPSEFCGYFSCIDSFGNSAGYVIQCRDGAFSTAGGRSGACSYHGGVRRPLYRH